MAVPYIFATATSSIPLSQLDTDLATPITIGNTAVQLGNTITTLYNMTLSNVTITSGTANVTANVTFNNANAVVYTNSSNVATTGTALTFDGTNLGVPAEVYRTTASSYLRLSGGDGAGSGANVIAFGQSHATAPGRLSLSSVGTGDIISNTISGAHIYQINSSEQMRLNSTGLGIGTSSFAGYLANKFVINTGTDSNNGITIASATNRNGSIWFADGTTGNQAYRGGVDYQHTTDTLYLYSGGNGNLLLDSSGNLGLGVTPSAWGLSGLSALQIKNASFFGYVNNAYMSANEYNDSAGTPRYIASAAATRYVQSAGTHAWYTAASGTAGNAITFTQAMTLDASGNLLVGTTSNPIPSTAVFSHVGAGVGVTVGDIATPANRTGINFRSTTENRIAYDSSGYLTFVNGTTERARITSGGDTRFGVTGTNSGIIDINTGTGAGSRIIDAINSAGNRYFEVQTDGDVYNTNGTYGTISDAKMKIDIVDAGSQWADIKAVRFRKFKMKDDPSGLLQLGVIAQELEQTSPGLVEDNADRDVEGNDLGTTTKTVKTSILLMKAAVALQEAMARIEQLEAKVAALEAK